MFRAFALWQGVVSRALPPKRPWKGGWEREARGDSTTETRVRTQGHVRACVRACVVRALRAPWGDLKENLRNSLSLRWVLPGETFGNSRISFRFRWVPLGRLQVQNMNSLSFRWLLPWGASGEPNDFLWFSRCASEEIFKET